MAPGTGLWESDNFSVPGRELEHLQFAGFAVFPDKTKRTRCPCPHHHVQHRIAMQV